MGAEIDRLEIQVETRAASTNKQLDALIEKLNTMSKSLTGISGTKMNSLSVIGTHASRSSSGVMKLSNSLKNLVSSQIQAKKSSNSLASSFGSFYANCFLAIRGVKALGKAVDKSMDYIETFNYYNVTLDKIGKEFSGQFKKYGYENAEDYTNSFVGRLNDLTQKMSGFKVGDDGVLSFANSKNLSLDPEMLMNYQASISAITNSVGLVGETSVNTSKALTMLASDMSSLKNIDMKTVMTNFQSGLIGQSRALYKYGIDITNATLQTYAYKYGLNVAVSEMTQADKMQLRLLAILDQSKVAWGDQANTINSVANQYRIFKQQISNVARAIGNLFIPVLQAVLPVINGVMIAFQRFVVFVGRLFGINYSKIMDGISSGYSSMGDSIGDVMDETDGVADSAGGIGSSLDDANKKAKKLQRTILGFDQINKLVDNTDTSSSGNSSTGSGAGGGAGGIDLSGAIADALADYEAVWNKALAESENKAQAYADRICKIFKKMWVMIRREDYEKLGKYIAGGVNHIFESINAAFNWDKMGPRITSFMDGLTRTLNSLVINVHWQTIGKTFGDGLNVITNTLYLWYAGIDWINIGSAIANGMNGMIHSIDWLMLGRTVGAWIMMIPKMIYGFVTNLDWAGVGKSIGTALNGALIELDGKTIAGGINGIVNGILSAMKAFIKTVDWGEVAKAVGDVLGNLDWGALAKVGLALAVVKLIGGLSRLLKDGIVKGLTDAIGHGLEGTISKLGSKLGGIFTAVGSDGATITGIKALGANISKGLGSVFGGISLGPVLAIAAGIAAIVAGIIDLWKTSETFRDNVKRMWDIIAGAFASAKVKIWDNGLKPLWDSIKELFGSLYQLYEGSGLKTIFEAVVTGIGYIASVVLAGLVEGIASFVQFVANGVQFLIDIMNGIVNVAIWLKDSMFEVWDWIKGKFTEFQEFLGNVFATDWSEKFGFFGKILNVFFDTAKSVIDSTKRIFGGIIDFVAGVFTGDWERAWNGIKDIFGGIWDRFTSIVKAPINAVLVMCEGLANGIIKAFNGIKKTLNKLSFDIPDWIPEFGGKSFGLHFQMTPEISLPRLAKGGLVDAGQLFIAREKGPELVGMHGNKSAVMNNDQLLDTVTDSIKDILVESLIVFGGNSGNEQPPTIEVIIQEDSETTYKRVLKGKKKHDRRYSAVVSTG